MAKTMVGPAGRHPARRAFLQGLGLCAALGLSPVGASEPPVRMGTSTPGGGFSLYGEMLQRVLDMRAGRPVLSAIGTDGTSENLKRLAQGDLDIALIQGTSASQVLQQPDAAGLRVLYAMYPSPGMLAVPAGSTARRFEDLRGQPVVFGVPSSGLVLLARQIFSAIGLDVDRDFKAIYVDQAGQAPPRVISGEAAGLWGAGEGWPGFVRLADAPGGARFLGPTPAQIPQILKAYPFLADMRVPAQAYRGMVDALPTVGSWNLILARADLPEARGYLIAKALHESAAALAAALSQASMTTAAMTARATPSAALLHPGTARLLRELALLPA